MGQPMVGLSGAWLCSSPVDGLSPECPQDESGLAVGVAQLGAASGSGAGAGAGFAETAFFFAAVFFGAAIVAAFFAAFLADFFGALATFFAAFAFFADFFEAFFAAFFFAATSFFYFAFLPFLAFFALAIVVLLLPPINVYQALEVIRASPRGADRSVRSWPGTARRPIEKLYGVDDRD